MRDYWCEYALGGVGFMQEDRYNNPGNPLPDAFEQPLWEAFWCLAGSHPCGGVPLANED